jgi:coproporphyrinogen III oxidase
MITMPSGTPRRPSSQQSTDPRFWSLFHSNWYHSIYLHKKTPVVPTKEVNWDWIAAKKNLTFNKIKATCDELEMTPLMSFKYD